MGQTIKIMAALIPFCDVLNYIGGCEYVINIKGF